MTEATLFGALRDVLRALAERRTDYMIVGGIALVAWIEPRATTDIDLVVAVSPDEAAAFARELAAALGGAASMRALRFRDGTRMQRITVSPGGREIVVDLILVEDDFLRAALARRIEIDVPTIGRAAVVSAEDLVVMKLRAYRAQDVVDARRLVGIDGFDRAYVERWAKRLRVLSRWRRIAGAR